MGQLVLSWEMVQSSSLLGCAGAVLVLYWTVLGLLSLAVAGLLFLLPASIFCPHKTQNMSPNKPDPAGWDDTAGCADTEGKSIFYP